MKFAHYSFLAAVLIFGASCSLSVNSTTGNSNARNTAPATTQAAATPAAPAAGETASAFVKELYRQHDKKESPFFQTRDRARVDKYFDKKLADLIWKDANDSKGEVGVIDGDPLYNAQDMEIKNFSVGAAKVAGEKAEVPVSFDNYGKKQNLTFMLVMRRSEYKIEDIKYPDGSTLLGWFKDAGQSETSSSAGDEDFEGKYQIGETTCTVKPVKMAFEVRWEKGSGTEMFFSEGMANDQFIFASQPEGNAKANIFSFDDETYTTGTFYRADGKEFPISKIK